METNGFDFAIVPTDARQDDTSAETLESASFRNLGAVMVDNSLTTEKKSVRTLTEIP